jgi:hypothetical protein
MSAQRNQAFTLNAASSSKISTKYMRRVEAANYLRENWGIVRAPQTLARYAVQGLGPKFVKAGHVPMYQPCWLDAWARDLIGDTSEAG